MKIAVVCANGKAGKLIVQEAVDRGHEVTAVVRGENKTAAQHVIQKDLFGLTSDDLAGFDVVVDAFGAWTPETLPQHATSLKHLCDVLSGTDARLIVVGGAGSLFVNPEHTATVAEGPEFPEAFKPLAAAMGEALGELRERDDVRWTYISPAGDFQADGPRTGRTSSPARSCASPRTGSPRSATRTTRSPSSTRRSARTMRTFSSASPSSAARA